MSSAKTNWRRAREYFGIVGQSNLFLHHKDPSLRKTDPERYYQWNPEDLEVLTKGEHTSLHNKLNFQGENNPMYGTHRTGEAAPTWGKKFPGMNAGEKNPMYGKPAANRGKPHSEETKRKISETRRRQEALKRGECI